MRGYNQYVVYGSGRVVFQTEPLSHYADQVRVLKYVRYETQKVGFADFDQEWNGTWGHRVEEQDALTSLSGYNYLKIKVIFNQLNNFDCVKTFIHPKKDYVHPNSISPEEILKLHLERDENLGEGQTYPDHHQQEYFPV